MNIYFIISKTGECYSTTKNKEEQVMCIAIIKEAGVEMPSEETLEICWDNNPDGAGFMYKNNGKLVIDKGYMKKDQFLKGLKNRGFGKDDFVVIHFRKSTSGGVTPDNTHPFPISEDINELQKWDIECDQAIVHNGVVGTGHKNLSDTAIFIRDCLADDLIMNNLKNSTLQNLLESAVDESRFLIVDIINDIYLKLGKWVFEGKNGLWFSNENYKNRKTTTTTSWNNTNYNNSSYNYNNTYNNTTNSIDVKSLGNPIKSVKYCPVCQTTNYTDRYVFASTINIYQCEICRFYFDENDKIRRIISFNKSNATSYSSHLVQNCMDINVARNIYKNTKLPQQKT